MKSYHKAKKRIDVSIGESVKIIRELQELSQMTYRSLPASRNRLFPLLSGTE